MTKTTSQKTNTLKHITTLTTGDWSDDGHGRTDVTTILSNLTKEELESAYKTGSKKVGVDLSEDIACDYEDAKMSNEVAAKFIKAGIDVSELCDRYDDDNYSLWTDSFALLWLAVAKLGNPELEYKKVERSTSNINIGGYGMFYN